MQTLHDEVRMEVEVAITAAWEAPEPDPATVLRHVFADEDP
jgi:TPP-dependent pyruvate/acetoin dehydrogenase alpha subunit